MNLFPRKNIHLDYAATTPLSDEAYQAMKPFFQKVFFNPSSLYDGGRKAREIVEDSRTKVARYLQCVPEEVYFTSGGTESTNLAIRGVLQAIWSKDPQRKVHIITTEFEHPATLELCKFIERKGWGEVTYVKPNEHGVVTPEMIEEVIREETVLVSIIHVHNETGVIQPVRAISRKIQKYKKDHGSIYPFLHTDSSQAPCYVRIQKESLGADMITLDASKFYGPKGIGILFVKKYVPIEPVMYGGGQENGLRPGTENVPGIVGAVKALEVAESMRDKEVARIQSIHDSFKKLVQKSFDSVIIHGEGEEKSPHILNVCFPGSDSEFLTIKLASRGVNVSFMTACKTAGDDTASHSIEAINPGCARSSVRFSFGRDTKMSDLKKTVKILKEVL